MNKAKTNEIEKTNRLSDVVLLRCFAISAVVLGHAMIVYSDDWNIFKTQIQSPFFNYLKTYINVFQMPLFVAISGFVYCHVKTKEKYGKFSPFLSSKFRRLIIPYLSVAVFYVLPIRELIHYVPYQGQSILSLLWNNVLLSKDIGHLWYLPTLFGIFIAFYVVEKFLNLLPIFITLAVLLFFSSISCYFPNILNIGNIVQFFFFFYIGYALRKKEKEAKPRWRLIAIFGILQFTGVLLSNCFIGAEPSKVVNSVTILAHRIGSVFGILFFYLLFTMIDKLFPKLAGSKLFRFTDKESFAIYLFHSPLMYIVLFFSADTTIQPVLQVSINFIVCLFGSLGISRLIRKTKALNFVIGK